MAGSDNSDLKYYLMEAAGLAGFVMIAGLLTIFLEHPDLQVMHTALENNPFLRRVPLGIIMGGYIYLVTILFGNSSGAHINPAASWSFFRLRKMNTKNMVFYIAAQFTGAIAAAQLLKIAVGHWFAHPSINYGVTAPKPEYDSLTAFAAEFSISFLLMFMILTLTASKKWKGAVPAISGLLLALFIIFEMPLSGMSMNPARSTAAAIAAGKFEHLWIYFVAPISAMLLAKGIFGIIHRNISQINIDNIPSYPIREKKA